MAAPSWNATAADCLSNFVGKFAQPSHQPPNEFRRSFVTTRAPALNDRQRAYLLAIFETDQETEQQMRDLPYRPFQPRPTASDWRQPVVEADQEVGAG